MQASYLRSVDVRTLKAGLVFKRVLVAGVAFAALVPGMASAQDDADATLVQRSAEDEQGRSDEIVVVARRVQESLQNVPLAITAISGDDLERRSIASITDLAAIVPSLSVARAGLGAAPSYTLRGIRSGVESYFAEIPTGTAGVDTQLWDLQSIQAIAGPQGTLFGRNSTGGAILFVPKKPTTEFEGYAKATIGNYKYREFEGVVNLPIADMLQVRLGGQTTNRAGLVKNISGRDLQSTDRETFRASVLFTPTDWLTNTTVFWYLHTDDTPVVQINQDGPFAQSPTAQARVLYRENGVEVYRNLIAAQVARGQRTADLPYPAYLRDKTYFVSNVLDVHFGDFSLQYIFGQIDSERHTFTSSSSIPLPLVIGGSNSDIRQNTHELRLIGNLFDDMIDFQVGGFYRRERNNSNSLFRQFVRPSTSAIVDPIDPAIATTVGNERLDTSKAVYGQATFHVTPELSFTGGIRYTEDNPTVIYEGRNPGRVCNLNPLPTVNLATCKQTLNSTFDAITYNLSVDYKISKDVLVYAATRRGYNAGGQNTAVTEEFTNYLPEKITDYEAGLKAIWPLGGGELRTNVAGFYAKYKNIQRRVTIDPPLLIRSTSLFKNAALATIYGAQLDISMRPIRAFNVGISYGYLHTQYDSSNNGFNKGAAFAQAPKHTLGANTTYTIDLGGAGKLALNADYQMVSSTFTDDNNFGIIEARIPGYGILNARVDWRGIGGTGIDLSAFVRNATNELYRVNASASAGLGTVTNIYGDPRLYGVEATFRF